MQLIERTVFCFLAASLWTGISAVVPLPEENMNVVRACVYVVDMAAMKLRSCCVISYGIRRRI